MKKLIIIMMLGIFVYPLVSLEVEAYSKKDNEISIFVEEYSLVESTWKDVKIKRGEDLYGLNDKKVGIVEAKFTGEDRAHQINGKVYYILPGGFFSKKEIKESYEIFLKSKNLETEYTRSGSGQKIASINYNSSGYEESYDYWSTTFYINDTHVPDLSSNVDSYSMSMSSKVWIENVPSFISGKNGMVGNCAPTAGAMLIAYYDNELWNNLSTHEGIWWWQDFPLIHEDDDEPVDDLILELADYYNTYLNINGDLGSESNCKGSTAEEIAYGTTEYLSDHYHSSYISLMATMADDYDDYSALILLGNPAIVNLSSSSSYGSHSVLGMGLYNAYMSPSGIIIYDNWNHGETWINLSIVTYYEFIYNE